MHFIESVLGHDGPKCLQSLSQYTEMKGNITKMMGTHKASLHISGLIGKGSKFLSEADVVFHTNFCFCLCLHPYL